MTVVLQFVLLEMAMSSLAASNSALFAKLSIIDEEEELSIGRESSCCTAEASISLASLFSEMEKLSVSTCDGQSFSLADDYQTALSNFDDFVFGNDEHKSDERIGAAVGLPRSWPLKEDNGDQKLGVGAMELNNYIPSQYDYYQCRMPQTYESMLHLCRSQKNILSFYQLPELNTKPIDYAPRLDFVSSQYELMEMHEYAAHHLPVMACKLKAEAIVLNNSGWVNANVSGNEVSSEYCLPKLI